MEAVRDCDALPAMETKDRLIQGEDRFAATAEQHDDMTIIVLKVA